MVNRVLHEYPTSPGLRFSDAENYYGRRVALFPTRGAPAWFLHPYARKGYYGGYHIPADFGVGKMGFRTGAAEQSGGSTVNRRGDPLLVVMKQDAQTLTTGAICFLAEVGSSFLLGSSSLIASTCWQTLN
jgi:hypothetical protein